MKGEDPLVQLDSFEAIVQGGARKVTWHVDQRDEWVPASRLEGAELEGDSSGPGVVWQQRTLIRLGPGTRLMRVESRPDRSVSRDPLDYLWQKRQGARRQVVRHYFRVGAGGELLRDR